MRTKLAILYLIMVLTLFIGIYAAIQCIPEPQEPEEPYEYDNLLPPISTTPEPTPVPDVSTGKPSSAPVSQPEEFSLDYHSLIAQNKDFIGWLRIDDTTISLPVVLGKDNSYYLKHTFTKKYSSYGCPFLDTRTPPDGDCLVIHGHNMGYNRTEIFSTLVYYEDPEYAKEHNILRFSRPDTEGEEYELFAVLNVDVNDESMNYIVSSFDSEDSRADFLSKLQKESLYPSKSDAPSGQILILSTCNRRYGEDNRLLIVAVEIVQNTKK